MSYEETPWIDFSLAPTENGSECLFWVSSEKGFDDIVAHFYLSNGYWYWMDTEEPLKRPDLIHGFVVYPKPGKR